MDPNETTYEELVRVMRQEFGPRECKERYFHEIRYREQRPGESLRDLGSEIKSLTTLAYPRTDKVERDRIATEYFKEAIADPRLQEELFRANPETLSDAMLKAEVVDSYYSRTQSKGRGKPAVYAREAVEVIEPKSVDAKVQELEEMVTKLAQQVRDSERQTKQSYKSEVECFACRRMGHIARDCPEQRTGGVSPALGFSVVRCYSVP
jgi:hypothetical protein